MQVFILVSLSVPRFCLESNAIKFLLSRLFFCDTFIHPNLTFILCIFKSFPEIQTSLLKMKHHLCLLTLTVTWRFEFAAFCAYLIFLLKISKNYCFPGMAGICKLVKITKQAALIFLMWRVQMRTQIQRAGGLCGQVTRKYIPRKGKDSQVAVHS